MRHSFLFAFLATVLLAGAAVPAQAHHSFAAFNMADQKTVTGTVKTVQWTNPHIWIWIDVTNDKGGSETYGFEGMSPNFLNRRGWTKDTLKPGDTITVSYRPMKDGSNGGMFVNGKTPGGKILTMGGASDAEPQK